MSDGMSVGTAYAIIVPCCILGLLYALFNYILVRRVNVLGASTNDRQLLDDR